MMMTAKSRSGSALLMAIYPRWLEAPAHQMHLVPTIATTNQGYKSEIGTRCCKEGTIFAASMACLLLSLPLDAPGGSRRLEPPAACLHSANPMHETLIKIWY